MTRYLVIIRMNVLSSAGYEMNNCEAYNNHMYKKVHKDYKSCYFVKCYIHIHVYI